MKNQPNQTRMLLDFLLCRNPDEWTKQAEIFRHTGIPPEIQRRIAASTISIITAQGKTGGSKHLRYATAKEIRANIDDQMVGRMP